MVIGMDIGIDFGTTNSSIARAGASGNVEVVQFASGAGLTDAYRSLLYLEQVTEGNLKTVKSWSGPVDRVTDVTETPSLLVARWCTDVTGSTMSRLSSTALSGMSTARASEPTLYRVHMGRQLFIEVIKTGMRARGGRFRGQGDGP